MNSNVTEYNLEYMGVKCKAVAWRYPEPHIFYFTKDGKEYEFTQTEDVHFIADIDHIRCVIGDQFLPWLKDEQIKDLKHRAEEGKMNNRLIDLFIEFDEMGFAPTTVCPNPEEMAIKWREQVLKEIEELKAENAALRERLDKAVELPFIVIDKKTGKEADEYEIALHEDWAKDLMYCDMEGFAIEQDGTLILLDECGRFKYCPPERFEIKNKKEGAE